MFEVDAIVTASRRQFLFESLQSIHEQKNCKVNLHIIKDGNCADISDITCQFACRVYTSTQCIGPYRLVNLIAPHLTSKYFCIQDSDDISVPHRLHCSLTACHENDHDVFGASIQDFTHDNMNQRILSPVQLNDACIAPVASRTLLFAHPTLVMKREYFLHINGYCNEFCACDVEFMNRCYWAGANIGTTHEVLVMHRIHNNQLTKHPAMGYQTKFRQDIITKLEHKINMYPQQRGNMQYFKEQGGLYETLRQFSFDK